MHMVKAQFIISSLLFHFSLDRFKFLPQRLYFCQNLLVRNFRELFLLSFKSFLLLLDILKILLLLGLQFQDHLILIEDIIVNFLLLLSDFYLKTLRGSSYLFVLPFEFLYLFFYTLELFADILLGNFLFLFPGHFLNT